MKIILLLIPLLFVGCAFQRATEVSPSGERTTYVGISWFNKTAVAGLQVGKRTASASTTLSLTEGRTESQADAIKAAGEALGQGIATGVKKSLVP